MHSTELHKCSKIYKKKLCEIASHKENLQKIVVIQRDSELFGLRQRANIIFFFEWSGREWGPVCRVMNKFH